MLFKNQNKVGGIASFNFKIYYTTVTQDCGTDRRTDIQKNGTE